jgi:ribose-phosphate pyrophosphokinase
MDKVLFFALPGNEKLAADLAVQMGADIAKLNNRHFTDGETYINVESNVLGAEIIIIASLHQPDDKFLPLYFLCKTVKELGAYSVKLVAPYLAYMRQDKRFKSGECISSDLFAHLLSTFIDELITIDPHLHRHHAMGEIYSIPAKVVHAAPLIAEWIKTNIPDAVLVGTDEESEQWVSAVAKDSEKPFIVLKKIRKGDKDVTIQVPDVSAWKNHIPVLIDDIISTARTMIETIGHLNKAGYQPPVCIVVHGIFAGNAFDELSKTGVRIVTCNTIPHQTNCIEINKLIVDAIKNSVASIY